jgi:class 3 adenylate cyclase
MEGMSLRITLLLLLASASLSAAPLVQEGRADLTRWDRTSAVALDGRWDFFPSALASERAPAALDVPGDWDHAQGQNHGWGTYRVTLQLTDPPPTDLALSLPLINSASEVLWNGITVWKTGTWSPFPQQYKPGRKTGVVALAPRAGDNTLEVRVANWDDVNSGLTESLHVGTLTGLLADRGADVTLAVFLFGCLFIMGVYHFGLFLYRPDDRSALWFGFLSILLGVRGLVYGSTYLADLLPGLGWEALMRLGYLTFSAPALLFSLFIRDVFPRATPRWFLPVAVVGSGLYTLAVLVLPAAWYTLGLHVFQGYVGVLGAIVVVVLVKAVVARERGARLFLTGFLIFFATVANDILKTNLYIPTPFLSPVGLLAFLVFQSMVLLKKFTAAFADSERNARHLVRLNASLERFIPREMLSFLAKESIVDVELGDHTEQPMSVMFVDIRDFTTLSETMSPEENFKFINSYLRRMGPVVRRHSGFVDKYMGDGIMALFPGSPRNALDAAVDLRAALVEYNNHRSRSGYSAIRMGIGIHRGALMLGTIGENQRMDSTVISDTVNAASRLEGLTKKFGKDILISGETIEALGLEGAAAYPLVYLDEETVKGRKRPLKVYALTPVAG